MASRLMLLRLVTNNDTAFMPCSAIVCHHLFSKHSVSTDITTQKILFQKGLISLGIILIPKMSPSWAVHSLGVPSLLHRYFSESPRGTQISERCAVPSLTMANDIHTRGPNQAIPALSSDAQEVLS